MTSAAFVDLSVRLREVKILSGLDPNRSTRRRPNLDLSGAVNRASIVLLSAHLEGYLEDVMVEALDGLVALGPKVEQLPLLLRTVHAEEHLRQIEPMKDRNSRAPRIERLFASESDMWATGRVLQATMIRQAAVCGQMNNPGSTQVRQFLELLSVDIEEHLTLLGKSLLLGQVNGLVSRRNAIAHGEADVATFGDVDRYVLMVQDLALEVDGCLAHAVQRICRSMTLPW